MRPGIIPLRPLGVGEILDGAIGMARRHPAVVLGLSVAVAAVSAVVRVAATVTLLSGSSDVLFSATPGQTVTLDDLRSQLSGLLGFYGLTGAIGLAAQVVLTGMLTAVLGRSVLGRSAPLAEVWREVRPRLLTVLGITLSVLVALVVLWCLVVGLVVGLAAALSGAPGGVGAAVVALAALVLVGGGLVLSVWLWVASSVAGPAAVLERAGVRAAFRRSFRLVRGSFWRVLGVLVLVQIAAGIAGGVLGGIFTGLALVIADASGGSLFDLGPQVVSGVGTVVAGTLTYPVVAGAVGLLYVDLRMRREGLDLELARAARAS